MRRGDPGGARGPRPAAARGWVPAGPGRVPRWSGAREGVSRPSRGSLFQDGTCRRSGPSGGPSRRGAVTPGGPAADLGRGVGRSGVAGGERSRALPALRGSGRVGGPQLRGPAAAEPRGVRAAGAGLGPGSG